MNVYFICFVILRSEYNDISWSFYYKVIFIYFSCMIKDRTSSKFQSQVRGYELDMKDYRRSMEMFLKDMNSKLF